MPTYLKMSQFLLGLSGRIVLASLCRSIGASSIPELREKWPISCRLALFSEIEADN